MATPLAREPKYGWSVRLAGRSLADARQLVTDALKAQGFGIVTELDVRDTLKKKLDHDFRPYVILGACNPVLAERALTSELAVGLLLPCNVCLWEDEGATVVAVGRPDAMFAVAGSPALQPIADEAQRRLEAVVAGLRG